MLIDISQLEFIHKKLRTILLWLEETIYRHNEEYILNYD